MTRTFITLIVLTYICFSAAHELCMNSLDPDNVQNGFCSEYSGHTCCSAERDAAIKAQYDAITPKPPEECLKFLRVMFCAEW